MKSYLEYWDENGVDYFMLELPEALVPNAALINEGQWVPSGKKDWMQRVDSANPALNQRRHVHIARAKHVNAKNMQASWNDDQTKHDKMSFNSKIASIHVVQTIARKALGLRDDVKLEEAVMARNFLAQINESIDIGVRPVLFVVKS